MELYKFCPMCKSPIKDVIIEGEKAQTCQSCGFIYWRKPKPVVSIILPKNGKVFILRRAREPFKNYWVLPGGFIRYDETPEAAIIRETEEEIGLKPELDRVVGAYRIDNDPRGVHIDIVYEGTITVGPKLSSESKTYTYADPNNLPEHVAYKHRQAIRDWDGVFHAKSK